MAEAVWRPLGVESEEDIAEYDALHDGVPEWMAIPYWAWVNTALATTQTIVHRGYANQPSRPGYITVLDVPLVEGLCQRLRITLPNFRSKPGDQATATKQRNNAITALQAHPKPLQIADYLLAHGGHGDPDDLDGILDRCKSAYTVGTRSGLPGLVRRVPEGVQTAADSVMQRAQRAGARLAKAWEALYGLDPDPSQAYRLAILAVEDAAIPVVSPTDRNATLGKMLAQIESQQDWRLPMLREHPKAPTGDVLVGMLRMLWHGQHDRHGGQPSEPGNVSREEAVVAVSVAVPLVNWFAEGLVERRPTTP